MDEAVLMRLVGVGAAVMCCITAASVATSVARSSARSDHTRSWWVQVLAFGLAALIVYVGYLVFESSYAWGNF